jgi:hypothetical protein
LLPDLASFASHACAVALTEAATFNFTFHIYFQISSGNVKNLFKKNGPSKQLSLHPLKISGICKAYYTHFEI